ncbi:MAG: tetratricopeptide repeat protein [Bryobacterales bacterium]|nr:tetratricopeptide repeat protein [Bryobacterales bacterium]
MRWLMVLVAMTAWGQTWKEHQARGEELFRAGKVKEAVKAFDKAIELEPRLLPYNWQRGIALYYAGQKKECEKQFELHATVNPNDVENSAFWYLCGKRPYVPVGGDDRVPMAEVDSLYAGKGSVEKVLAAAARGGGDGQFYGHLYVGLWYEANGECRKGLEYLSKAAGEHARNHYMGDVARVHVKLVKCRAER